MESQKRVWLGVVLILSSLALTRSDEDVEKLGNNFHVTTVLPDGEQEVRMRLGDAILRETFVTHETPDGERKGLMLRQIGMGPHFLQLIFKLKHQELPSKHKKLIECEVVHDLGSANAFRTQFQDELKRAGLSLKVPANTHKSEEEDDLMESSEEELMNELSKHDPLDLDQGMDQFRNVTVKLLTENEVTEEMRKAFNIHAQQKHCRRLHRRMKSVVDARETPSNSGDKTSTRRVRREAFRFGIMPGTFWCGDGSLADKYESMGAHVGADRCCREHDGCPFIINAMSSKFGLFNYRMHTISYCACDERSSNKTIRDRKKREVYSPMRLPGTHWCGRGFHAQDFSHLGGFTGTDNCCRRHDLGCPFYIEAFQEKYSLFNWRMYTINHCSCDERFRSCLKQTNTGAANFVGKVFFNIVQTKCFLLKPERSCAKVSWWGKCLKHEYKKQAHLRDPIPY